MQGDQSEILAYITVKSIFIHYVSIALASILVIVCSAYWLSDQCYVT